MISIGLGIFYAVIKYDWHIIRKYTQICAKTDNRCTAFA